MSEKTVRWIQKYKILHIMVWSFTMVFSFVTYYDRDRGTWSQIANVLCSTGLNVVPFYLTGYYFVPKLWYKRRFTLFSLKKEDGR